MKTIPCLMPCRRRRLIVLIVMALAAYGCASGPTSWPTSENFRANHRGQLESRGRERHREVRRRWGVPCR